MDFLSSGFQTIVIPYRGKQIVLVLVLNKQTMKSPSTNGKRKINKLTTVCLSNTLHNLLLGPLNHFIKLLRLESLELFQLSEFSSKHPQVTPEC